MKQLRPSDFSEATWDPGISYRRSPGPCSRPPKLHWDRWGVPCTGRQPTGLCPWRTRKPGTGSLWQPAGVSPHPGQAPSHIRAPPTPLPDRSAGAANADRQRPRLGTRARLWASPWATSSRGKSSGGEDFRWPSAPVTAHLPPVASGQAPFPTQGASVLSGPGHYPVCAPTLCIFSEVCQGRAL